MLKESDIFVSIVDTKMESMFYAADITYNFELALFSVPRILDTQLDVTIEKVKAVLDRHPIRKGIHGPVNDLIYDSRDPLVQEVARTRTRQGIDVASRIGAEYMVVHSSFLPYGKCATAYPDEWVKRSTDFWGAMAEEAAKANVKLVIENIFDEEPLLLKKLITAVNAPSFKASIDVGHLNLFSKVPMREWIDVYRDDLQHTHLHNNHGVYDEHAGVMDGTFDVCGYVGLLKEYRLSPVMTLELRKFDSLEKSLEMLKEWIGE